MSPLRTLRIVRQRVRALLRRSTLDNELDRELAFHFDRLVAEYTADGMSPADARNAAKRDLGNLPLLAEQCRDQRRLSWLDDLRQDTVHGARLLARTPRVAGVIVASLALGIGANTAVLGVMDAVLRARLPFPAAEGVVVARAFHESSPGQDANALVAEYFAWKEHNRSFAAIGVAMGNPADFGDWNGAPAERIQGAAVTPELFSVLRVPPALGRVFDEQDVGNAQTGPPLVLSYRLWQRRFGGAPDVIGSRVRLNHLTARVIGVMPERFRYPSEVAEYWVPLVLNRSDVRNPQRFFGVTARLKEGVTAEQAQTDLNAITRQLVRQNSELHAGWHVRVKGVRDAMFGWTRQPLVTLWAAVALVLLVACTNVAGLLLARALARRPEMEMRAALGAGRGRLVRQMLAEAALLSGAGATLGLFLAWSGVRALLTLSPPPGAVAMVDVAFGARMAGLAALIALAATFVFGLVPALAAAGKGERHASNGKLREGLVAAQIAVTFVLLIGAGLLTKSFILMITREVHFDTEKLLTFQLNIPPGEYMHRRGSVAGLPYFEISPPPSLVLRRVHDRLRRIPGAAAVAGASSPLVNSLTVPSMAVKAWPLSAATGPAGSVLDAAYFLVTPHFFSAAGASLVGGRDFDERDTASATWVAIVNESAARRLWSDGQAVGRRLVLLRIPEEKPREVVGIIRDIPLTVGQTDGHPVVYTPYLQQPRWYPLPGANIFGQMTFMVRSAGDPMALLPAARRVVAEIVPDRPLANIMTMEQQLMTRVPRRGDFILAIVAFALAAAVLAAIGIYGVVAYTATRRTREIGIRMALGAAALDIVGLVGARAVRLIAVGLVAGAAGSLAAVQLLQSQLWGVAPTDPVTFAGAALLLVVVSALACALPTRQATAVNPTTALRCE